MSTGIAKSANNRPAGKAEETRTRILNAALDLFRERGFEPATMRDIAKEAGVATGAAYYYFASKEDLVMAFYDRAADEMRPRIEEALAATKGLQPRLQAILTVKFEYFAPNRKFLGALVRHAADPEHPLSPVSSQTAHIRTLDWQHFGNALEGGDVKIPADLRDTLPMLFWLYQMGVILFWIYDRTPGQRRTALLVEMSLNLLVSLLKLATLPLMRPLRKRIVELVQTVITPEPVAQ